MVSAEAIEIPYPDVVVETKQLDAGLRLLEHVRANLGPQRNRSIRGYRARIIAAPDGVITDGLFFEREKWMIRPMAFAVERKAEDGRQSNDAAGLPAHDECLRVAVEA